MQDLLNKTLILTEKEDMRNQRNRAFCIKKLF